MLHGVIKPLQCDPASHMGGLKMHRDDNRPIWNRCFILSVILHNAGTVPLYQISSIKATKERNSWLELGSDQRWTNSLPFFKVSRLMVHNAKYEYS